MDTLKLNADHRPVEIIPWRKAVELLVKDKVGVVVSYNEWVVRSPSTRLKVPSVVFLKEYAPVPSRVPFNRRNVYTRDRFTCQYCRQRVQRGGLRVRDLTFDHVNPECYGGTKTWENIVTSCKECNQKKGGRTPEEADMQLFQKPYHPKSVNPVAFDIIGKDVPDVWLNWVDTSWY